MLINLRKYIKDILNDDFLLFVVFNIIINSLLTFFDRQGVLAYLRATVIYVIIGKLLINKNCFRNSGINIVFLLILYFFFLTFFSSNFSRSINLFFKVSASMLLLPISIYYIKTKDDLLRFMTFFKFAFLYFICFAVMSSIWGFGWNQYARNTEDQAISIGFGDSQLYTFSLALVAIPFYKKFTAQNISRASYVIMFVSFLLLIFSMRRTAVLIVVLGYFLYFLFSGTISKFLKLIIVGTLLLVLLFPFYKDALMKRIALRKDVIENDKYSLEEEGRWRETFLLLHDISRYDRTSTILFGKEIFNSPGNYANGAFGKRMLHVDYNRILHGSGIIGLGIYILLYVIILRTFYFYYRRNNTPHKKYIKSLFLTYYILSLFISFSGQMDDVTFRSILFIIMGASIGIMKNKIKRKPINIPYSFT